MNNIMGLEGNNIIGNYSLNNSTIEFYGKGNILILSDNTNLTNSRIRFTGNNSILYIDKNKMPLSLDVRLGNDSVSYIGKNVYTNKCVHIYATERENVIIGDDCLLSYEVTFRTADPHLIYDSISKKRINSAKSILVGDHVWIGQEALILKNTKIYSGSIIGGKAVISNKEVLSNTMWAGNPARKIKDDVFFISDATHDYTESDINNSLYNYSEDFIYSGNPNDYFEDINQQLKEEKSNTENKILTLKRGIVYNTDKNRFAKK